MERDRVLAYFITEKLIYVKFELKEKNMMENKGEAR